MFVNTLLQALRSILPTPTEEITTENAYSLNEWPRKPKVQFILKQRNYLYADEEGSYSYGTLESGLYNSANFVCEMLNHNDCDSEIIQVVDNNGIDREVTRFRPDIVVIEAFWVVPDKFEILQKLHPNVKWIVRNHSRIPFLANEGIAMDWIIRYAGYPNVYISSNTENTNGEVIEMVEAAYPEKDVAYGLASCPYLPNYYPMEKFQKSSPKEHDREYIDIGCFGAIRPLKNHLLQAIAAITFAEFYNKTLRFHINGVRTENRGEPVLNNLRGLFSKVKHELVEHAWMKHDDFLNLIQNMDVCMQVSYTETFNIVSADVVSQGVPIVTSPDIDWSVSELRADPNSSSDMFAKLDQAYHHGRKNNTVYQNRVNISRYNDASKEAWINLIDQMVFQK